MSETADTLRAWAREALERARKAKDAGDYTAALKHADFAAACEAKAAGLTTSPQRRRVNSEQPLMTDAHRAALSESRKSGSPFLKWIRLPEHGRWSLNRLAEAVGMSPASLSQSRLPKTHKNFRPIHVDKAKQIEALTGWPASSWSGFTEG